ncbi:hypothetical protein MFLAVUS_005934 [Mucor flavus]|uniref:DNA primase n=1 Tax=Mucor flavus TaxID=439312 RepID=A0ABP9Z053_9FUNG
MEDLSQRAQQELEKMDLVNFFSDEEEFAPEDQHMNEEPAPEDQQMNEDFSKVNIATEESFNDKHNQMRLYRMFYDNFFPYKLYFHWLNYDITPTKNFTHREFSFTLPNDIYIRFKSFENAELLKKEIERLQPIKIDIGAVYSVQPKYKKTVSEKAFKPTEKELVFDIDMTDYDEVRTCCSGGDICLLCWEFMTVAIKIVDQSLREDFGFKHIMWVYSGRRGVHCWVCDERARKLDNDSRKAIINFLDIIKGGAHVSRKVKLPNILHPSLKRSFEVVKQHFNPLLIEKMGILDNEESWNKVLDIIPDSTVREKLAEKWKDNYKCSANEKWDMLVKEEEKSEKKKKFKDPFLRDIMFQYCYPRLDVKVSTNINHLLKSPFCVHPKTLKVCVPIKPEECEHFDPITVPNLNTLRKEVMEFDQQQNTDAKLPDYKKTSLKPYIEYFDKFVKSLLSETIQSKRDAAEKSMEF